MSSTREPRQCRTPAELHGLGVIHVTGELVTVSKRAPDARLEIASKPTLPPGREAGSGLGRRSRASPIGAAPRLAGPLAKRPLDARDTLDPGAGVGIDQSCQRKHFGVISLDRLADDRLMVSEPVAEWHKP